MAKAVSDCESSRLPCVNIELIEELDESIKYFDMNLEDLLSEEFHDFLINEDMVIESLDNEDDEIILYDEI